MNAPTIERPARAAATTGTVATKTINLALQGGGAHDDHAGLGGSGMGVSHGGASSVSVS